MEHERSDASKLFEAKWRDLLPRFGLPSSDIIDASDFDGLSPYLLKGEFTRPTGPAGEGARMDIDFAGDGIASRLNVDITGFEYFRRLLPDDRHLISDVFEALFDNACGRWRVMFYRFDKGLKLAVDTTFFPYLCDQTGAERVCALIVPAKEAIKHSARGRVFAAESGPSAAWINFGHGTPDAPMLSLESA